LSIIPIAAASFAPTRRPEHTISIAFGHANQARQTLGAARARDHSECNFGQPDDCAGRGDARVAAERQFVPPTERRAMMAATKGFAQASIAAITAGS
jgi:hypothetical protein